MTAMSPINISAVVFASVFGEVYSAYPSIRFCQASISTRVPRMQPGSGWHWSGPRSRWCWDCSMLRRKASTTARTPK